MTEPPGGAIAADAVDVLLLAALPLEYDAARLSAEQGYANHPGVRQWSERAETSAKPYALGTFELADGKSFSVAITRQTRMGTDQASGLLGSLIAKLKPKCLAMCGVCAGRPGSVELGDVIIAEPAYFFLEGGKAVEEGFLADVRPQSMQESWIRAAQDFSTDDLAHFRGPTDDEAKRWFLECLYVNRDPREEPARDRYFDGSTWQKALHELEADDLIDWSASKPELTKRGRNWVARARYADPDWPQQLPFKVHAAPMASGPFVASNDPWRFLTGGGLRSVRGLEMEAAAVASARHRYNIPNWIVAKGVMDFASSTKDDRFKKFAAWASAEVLWKFLVERRQSEPQSIVKQPTPESAFAEEINLVEKVRHLDKPLPLRILFALSPTRGSHDLAQERATLIETIHRAFIQPNLADKFQVQLLQWDGFTSARQIAKSGQAEASMPEPPSVELDIVELDLVIIVVWHDLGAPTPDEQIGAENELSWLAARTREVASNNAGQPRLLLFRRRSNLQLEPDAPDLSEMVQRYARVNGFFGRLPSDQYIPYTLQSFFSLLEWQLRVAVSSLLDHKGSFGEDLAAAQVDNPFRGLDPYEEQDAAGFFGRADEINDLAVQFSDLVETAGLLVVAGASGTGKSSLVRAGLLPRLKLDGMPGSSRWQYCTVRLSQEIDKPPLDVILDSLAGEVAKRRDREKRRSLVLSDDPTSLTGLIEQRLAGSPLAARVVLFIDQFEELFALIDEEQRAACVQFLEKARVTPRLTLIVSVRSDFYHRCLEDGFSPELADRFKTSTYWLTAPKRNALLAMIIRPVLFAGAIFEDGDLPIEILEDTGGSAGALPLMSCALEKLYDRSYHGVLTRGAYNDLYRVSGIIQGQADDALAEVRKDYCESDVREGLNFVFRSLVGVDEYGTTTRKPARLAQFTDSPAAGRLVDALVERRLLQSDVQGADSVVNLAHEAVLSHWHELEEWTGTAHEALLLVHRVERAAQDWAQRRAQGGSEEERLKLDRDLLWRQDRLDEVQRAYDLLGMEPKELSPEVCAFTRPEFDRLLKELKADIQHERRAEIGERIAILKDRRPGVGLRPDGLPDIDWCAVPAGKVALRAGETVIGEFEVPSFRIARYPVTLCQFKAFTDKDYDNPSWWSGMPIGPATHRPYPQTPEVSNHPAQYVSWYQALAFCSWLSHKLGYTVVLPTEWEWVQAAIAGHPDYEYPWGVAWNPNYANHRKALYHLISVGMYPQGASPVGALDLSGNTYEWCRNEFADLAQVGPSSGAPHTTRGGAFFAMPPGIEISDQLSIHHRLRDNPNGIGELGQRIAVGFRLACYDRPSDSLAG